MHKTIDFVNLEDSKKLYFKVYSHQIIIFKDKHKCEHPDIMDWNDVLTSHSSNDNFKVTGIYIETKKI